MVNLYRAAAGGAALALLAVPIGLWLTAEPAAPPPPALPAPGAHFEIRAAVVLTDGRTDSASLQSCGIYWVEGSATEVERVCENRKFDTRPDAEAALEEARATFPMEGVASVEFSIEEIQP